MIREIVLDTETTGRIEPDRPPDRRAGLPGTAQPHLRRPGFIARHFYLIPNGRWTRTRALRHRRRDACPANRSSPTSPQFLDFIADAPLVIHSAAFDVGFPQRRDWRGRGLERAAGTGDPDTTDGAAANSPARPPHRCALQTFRHRSVGTRTKHGAASMPGCWAGLSGTLRRPPAGSRALAVETKAVRDLGARPAERRARPAPLCRRRLTGAEAKPHAAFVAALKAKRSWKRYLD